LVAAGFSLREKNLTQPKGWGYLKIKNYRFGLKENFLACGPWKKKKILYDKGHHA
jgi:hypothetical protein